MSQEQQKSLPQSDDEITGVAAYFIRNRVISWMVSLIFLIGGVSAFFGLGRLEDPAFTIKDAMVVTCGSLLAFFRPLAAAARGFFKYQLQS